VLFGGSFGGGSETDQTWTWDGSDWTQARPASSPPARFGAGIAYDSARAEVVLFGGGTRGAGLGDTWTWNGSTWTQQSPAISPPPRAWPAMTYDRTSSLVILFGGVANDGTPLSDTWAWDGRTWRPVNPSHRPPARYGAAFAYDTGRATGILFGACCPGTNGGLNDTWAWDGTDWTELHPAASPPPRAYACMAYDLDSGDLVLFGGLGYASGGQALGDTWLWDGSGWTEPSGG
jgi:hypothetical protein